MKMGPVTLSFSRNGHTEAPKDPVALAQERGRPDMEERGQTGTQVFGGMLTHQDYNPDLMAPGCYDVYDKMRLSDGQVRAAMAAVKLPILRADWNIKPGSDSAQDRQIAEEQDYDIKHMSRSFGAVLREALLMLDYGSMPFEHVWEIGDDRKVHLAKLAPRHPRTVLKWLINDHGGLAGIEQLAPASTEWKIVTIPVEKLVVFVNEQEGSNFRGISMLRAAYKHWYYKEGLYRVDAIAKERRGVGIDVGTIKSSATDRGKLKTSLEKALATLHAHEKQFFVEDEDKFTYRLEGGQARGLMDALPSIEHHDLRIVRSVLAEFLAMGTANSGSLAMHRDKSSFFVMALQTIADSLADAISDYVLRPWTDYNYPNIKNYPRLTYTRLDTRDVGALAKAVADLMGAGALTGTFETENNLRELIEIAPIEESEYNESQEAAEAEANDGTFHPEDNFDGDPDNDEDKPEPRKIAARRLTKKVKFEHVDIDGLNERYDRTEKRIISAVKQVQTKQIAKLRELGEKIVERGDAAAVERVDVPFRSEVATEVLGILTDLFHAGASEVRAEFSRQGMAIALEEKATSDEEDILAFLGLRARSLANLMADRLKSTFVWEMLSQLRKGSFDRASLTTRLRALSDREIRKVAAGSISEALSLGRQSAAEESKQFVSRAVFSSVLDKNSCGPCLSLDGTEFSMDDPEIDNVRPPYKECDGSDRCRCMLVYVLKEVENAGS